MMSKSKRPWMTEHMYHVLRLAKLGFLYSERGGNWIADPCTHDGRNVSDPWPSSARACLRRGWIKPISYLRAIDCYFVLTLSGRKAMKEFSGA